MSRALHDLAPGYYWYSVEGDPYCVMHIHDNGRARLMGTDVEVSVEDIAALIQRGCNFFWIEPPVLNAAD